MDSLKSFVSGTDSTVGQCSNEEILKAAGQRTDGRNFVMGYVDPITKSVKPWMIEQKIPQAIIDELTGFFDKEAKWWENTKLCEIDIKTRLTSFKEKADPFLKSIAEKAWPTLEAMSPEDRKKALDSNPIRVWREVFDEKNKGLSSKEEEKKKEEKKVIQGRGFTDNLRDGFTIALQYLIPVIWIILGLRFGGLAANELLYKPIPYRILAWLYTFVFTPLFIPYYGYKEIKWAVYPFLKRLGYSGEEPELPRFESLLPIFPFEPTEDVSLFYKVFGYPSTKENEAWVQKKQQEENEAKTSVLAGTAEFLASIIKAKEESMKEK
jgi:hypothetical protein